MWNPERVDEVESLMDEVVEIQADMEELAGQLRHVICTVMKDANAEQYILAPIEMAISDGSKWATRNQNLDTLLDKMQGMVDAILEMERNDPRFDGGSMDCQEDDIYEFPMQD